MHYLTVLSVLALQSAVMAAPASSAAPAAPAASASCGADMDPMDLILALEVAPTAAQRHSLLPNASQWLYDFNNPPSTAITSSSGKFIVYQSSTAMLTDFRWTNGQS
jgi:hypothetical protein